MSLIEKYISQNHFGKKLGMHFNIIADGEVEYFLKITQDHLATPLAAHGGVISALADAALGVCGLSAVYKENKVVSTVEYKINFLSPGHLNDELYAHAKVLQKGKRILIIECSIFSYLPLGGSTLSARKEGGRSHPPLEGGDFALAKDGGGNLPLEGVPEERGGGRKLIAKAMGTFNAYDASKAGY